MKPLADPSRETEVLPEATDSDLLRAHLAGAATAFDLLYWRYHHLVWRTCRRLVPAAEVEPAVQAVFLVLLRQAARVQHHPCLPAWLVTTADLTCRSAERDRRRRQHRHEPLPVADLVAPPASTREEVQVDAVFSAVTASLGALNPRQQAVVVRHLMQGEPQATLAGEFGVAVGTIASDLNRALARLRRMLSRRGLTVSALALGLACSAEAEAHVLPISSAIHSPSPQALALAHQVDSIMRQHRLRRHLGWAFALLGCLASGGVAVELGMGETPVAAATAPPVPLPAMTGVAIRLVDLDRSHVRFAGSPYAGQGWSWPAYAQQVRMALEPTRSVELGFCFDKSKTGGSFVLQLAAPDEAAVAATWESLFKTYPDLAAMQSTAPLRWELRQSRKTPVAGNGSAKNLLSIEVGSLVQEAAPGLSAPIDPEADLELLIRSARTSIVSICYTGDDLKDIGDTDRNREGLPRYSTFDWRFTPNGVRETFRRIPGVDEAARLAADPGAGLGSAVFAPLGGDTLAAIAIADPGATLIAPWLMDSRSWCDDQLTSVGLPTLTELIAQLHGTAVLALRAAAPFPVVDLDLTCTREFGTAVLEAFARRGATADGAASAERMLVAGPLVIRMTWSDGRLRATTDPQGFRAPPPDAGAFLRDPEIVAARARCGEAPARILGLSRSGALWSTAARLLSGMGLPLARDLPQRLAAHAGGGYLRYMTTPASIVYDAEGLAGGPLGLVGVVSLIVSQGEGTLDPANLWRGLAAALTRF